MKKINLKKMCLSLSVLLGIFTANGSEVFAYNPEDVVLIGDINQSGTVDITDLTQLSLYLIGDTKFSDREEKIADTDMNGVVDLCDLANFKNFLSKGTDENSLIMIGKTRLLDTTSIERAPIPEFFPPTTIIPGNECEQPEPITTPVPNPSFGEDDMKIERVPMPDILPVNAENNNYNYATLSGKTYSKHCTYVFSENQIDEKSMLAFIIEDVAALSGTMAEVNTLNSISSEYVLLLKCGKTEGKYYIFINEKITEEAQLYLKELGVPEYTMPHAIPEVKFEQPLPAMEP